MGPFQNYVSTILVPQLRPFGVTAPQLAELTSDLERRFQKILRAKSTPDEWLALLEPNREEALRYLPKEADEEIKLLVNAFLRNSLFEDLCCDRPYSPQFRGPRCPIIPDGKIQEFTSGAISFFQQHRSELLGGESGPSFQLATRFPLAHRAFWEVSRITGGETAYPPVEGFPRPPAQVGRSLPPPKWETEVLSGFDPTVSRELQDRIDWCGQTKAMFFVPHFKFLSRNVEKVFQVVDEVLSNGCPFVTMNYVLSNGLVSKRRGLLPVGHDSNDYQRHLSEENGLSQRHKKHLHRLR